MSSLLSVSTVGSSLSSLRKDISSLSRLRRLSRLPPNDKISWCPIFDYTSRDVTSCPIYHEKIIKITNITGFTAIGHCNIALSSITASMLIKIFHLDFYRSSTLQPCFTCDRKTYGSFLNVNLSKFKIKSIFSLCPTFKTTLLG